MSTIRGEVQSFRLFVEHFWQFACNDPFKPGLVVDAICEHLQALKEGKIKRLAIACPPKHGKSTLTEVLFPAWLWIHDPSLRFLTVSHGERLAIRDAALTRDVILSHRYQQYFGHLFKIKDDTNAKSSYATDKMGSRLALGTSSNTSGQNADIITGDDVLDYDKAKSEIERENVKRYWDGTLSQRLATGNNKDRLLLIGHRVHEDDVFQHIYNQFGNDGTWTYLVLPSEANHELTDQYYNGIGWVDPRKDGELLNAKRFPQEELDVRKKQLRHEFSCLWNMNPVPQDGDLFSPSWFRTYHEDEKYYYLTHDGKTKKLMKEDAWRIQTVDTAVTTSKDSDWSVVQTWDIIGDYMILVDQLRKKLDGVRIVPTLYGLFQQHEPQFISIESEFVGQFVIDQLRATGVCVKPFRSKGHGDKETRAIAAEIRMEAGKVWFPERPWVGELQRELLGFPNGSHDDQVDCISQCAILVDKYRGKLTEELTPEQEAEKERQKKVKEFNRILWADNPIRFRR